MEMKNRTKREGGFTLIELITVIIILGILAAVVTPRYFNMVNNANTAAAQGAAAEAAGRLNLEYANSIITNGTPPANLAALTGLAGNVDMGDYIASYAAANSGADVAITVTEDGGTNTTTITVPWPGN